MPLFLNQQRVEPCTVFSAAIFHGRVGKAFPHCVHENTREDLRIARGRGESWSVVGLVSSIKSWQFLRSPFLHGLHGWGATAATTASMRAIGEQRHSLVGSEKVPTQPPRDPDKRIAARIHRAKLLSAFAELEKSAHQRVYSRRMGHLENLVSQDGCPLQHNRDKLEFFTVEKGSWVAGYTRTIWGADFEMPAPWDSVAAICICSPRNVIGCFRVRYSD